MTDDIYTIAASDITGDEVRREKTYSRVLIIAGSEPLGSAGVQADIKSVSACGAYAAGSITCIVNEDTTRVKEIFPLPADFVIAQAESFLGDVGADAIKVGMLFTQELITKVAKLLERFPDIPAVVDPVMVNSTGQRLIELEAIQAYRQELFPRAAIITPNCREASLLLGHQMSLQSCEEDMATLRSWCPNVVVKSLRPDGRQLDVAALASQPNLRIYEKALVKTPNVNGTGCSFSSSVAAYLARGASLAQAIDRAERYIDGAIRSGASYRFGKGFGPVNHFYRITREDLG